MSPLISRLVTFGAWAEAKHLNDPGPTTQDSRVELLSGGPWWTTPFGYPTTHLGSGSPLTAVSERDKLGFQRDNSCRGRFYWFDLFCSGGCASMSTSESHRAPVRRTTNKRHCLRRIAKVLLKYMMPSGPL